MGSVSKKNKTENVDNKIVEQQSYMGLLGLLASIGFGTFTLYINFKEGYQLDIIISNLFATFYVPSIVYSYFAWTIFITIYGVLTLYERVHETGPERNSETLVSKNFGYALWFWGAAAVIYQQVALTVKDPAFTMLYEMLPTDYSWFRVILSVLVGLWGLHHIIAGRIFLNGYWVPDIHKYDGHKIIKDGIYNFTRHPIYGGQFLFTLSLFIMWNNWVLILLPIATFLANHKRARTEEAELERILDGAYNEYKRLTPSYMFCLPKWSRLVRV